MQKQKLKTSKSNRCWAIVVAVFVTVAVLIDVCIVGNIGYAIKWAQCGGRPVVAGRVFSVGFGAAPERVVIRENPGFFEAKRQVDGGYYCTIDQAKSAFPAASQIDIQ